MSKLEKFLYLILTIFIFCGLFIIELSFLNKIESDSLKSIIISIVLFLNIIAIGIININFIKIKNLFIKVKHLYITYISLKELKKTHKIDELWDLDKIYPYDEEDWNEKDIPYEPIRNSSVVRPDILDDF